MRPLFDLNDLHLGAERSGGTTPLSKFMLRESLLAGFNNLLELCEEGDLIINGDLLDTEDINKRDWLIAINYLRLWLKGDNQRHLYLPPGNHDLSRNVNNLSSFQLMARMLANEFPMQVRYIKEPTLIAEHDAYVIPHMPNQDLFDAALAAVPKCRLLFLHCNVNNKFAVVSDHSLNITLTQCEAAPVDHVIVAHEHQRSSHCAGKVIVVGNQIPSSIADCLGNDVKYMLKITDKGIEHVPVWESHGSFERMNWKELKDSDAKFIRVEGKASTIEASDAVLRLSRYRAKSDAFVISNAIEVEGAKDKAQLMTSLEEIRGFQVIPAVLKLLTKPQRTTVEKLMEEHK